MDEQDQLSKSERKRLRSESIYKVRKIKKTFGWIVGTAVVAGAIWGLAVWSGNTEESLPGEAFSIVGRNHIAVNEEHEPYNSNPPTSGPHYGNPAPWGAYQEELPDETLIHNLEHGGIWISYGAAVDKNNIIQLEEIGQRFPKSVIVTPRMANDSPVVIASWGRFLKLDFFDEQQIVNFITKNRNRSPERLAL